MTTPPRFDLGDRVRTRITLTSADWAPEQPGPVWLAYRACRWARCSCSCHTGAVPEPTDRASDLQLSLL